jgi:CBS domain-containing protein
VGQWSRSVLSATLNEEHGQVLIEHILHAKGHEVATIAPDAAVADALVMLREHNVGALVVAVETDEESDEDGDEAPAISGIISERDIVRALADAVPDPAGALQQPVSALMSTDLTTCEPGATVDDLMRTMTDRRIRHIPVLDQGRLAGIVSIGDVVKTRIDELTTEAETLHEYLSSGR